MKRKYVEVVAFESAGGTRTVAAVLNKLATCDGEVAHVICRGRDSAGNVSYLVVGTVLDDMDITKVMEATV